MFKPRAWKLSVLTIFICLVQIHPVNAQNAQTVDVELTITKILEFEVDPISLTYALDAWSQSDVETNIGAIEYTLSANQPWQIDAIVLDDDDDWDENWTLTVNGETINETTSVTIDSLGTAVHRVDALWEVYLTVPWSGTSTTPDCTIQLIASLP